MTPKRRSNKELNEELDAMALKYKALEILVEQLVSKSKEKDAVQERLEERMNDLIAKVKEQDTELNKIDVTKNISEESFRCCKCDAEFKTKGKLKKHYRISHSFVEIKDKHCKYCDKRFQENYELEVHMKSHSEAETYRCDQCDKTFVLKWRQKQHVKGHESRQESKVFCHYFNNRKVCPFEELGCMFLHSDSPECKFNKKCKKKLCQFKHSENDTKDEYETNEKKSATLSCKQPEKSVYNCKKCSKELTSNDDLEKHMEDLHTADGRIKSFCKTLESDCEKCQKCTDGSCDRCIMAEVIKEVMEANYI